MKNLLPITISLLPLFLAGCNAGGSRVGGPAAGQQLLLNRDKDGLAIQGFDPVAYFTDARPLKGDPRYRVRRMGVTYQFVSAEHKAAFEASPAKYEPQFGGYCAYAASINKISPISPEYWEIRDGRLLLQHNQRAVDLWSKDAPGNLRKADANWPALVQRFGKSAKLLVNVDKDGIALQGFDPVAYFTDQKPTRGLPEFESVFGGARYRFASREHRETFEQDPTKYEPQFGGFCGYAASINKISPVDPNIFQIINGRLVLQHTPKAYELFNKNPQASLANADRNWPGLVERKGS